MPSEKSRPDPGLLLQAFQKQADKTLSIYCYFLRRRMKKPDR